MPIEHLISKAEVNPKNLFLIDGLGAILSAFLLGFVLVKFQIIFGIPPSTLYILAVMPLFIALCDFYCYRKSNQKTGLLLKIIAILNLTYCSISLGFVFYHFETITNLGLVYILIEIVIVLLFAIIEFITGIKVIKESTKQRINI